LIDIDIDIDISDLHQSPLGYRPSTNATNISRANILTFYTSLQNVGLSLGY